MYIIRIVSYEFLLRCILIVGFMVFDVKYGIFFVEAVIVI